MRVFLLCVLLFGCTSEKLTPVEEIQLNTTYGDFCEKSSKCMVDDSCARWGLCKYYEGNCFQCVGYGEECRKENCKELGHCTQIGYLCIAFTKEDCNNMSEIKHGCQEPDGHGNCRACKQE